MPTSYDTIRTSVVASGTDSRVEVNQRALIDKILARYASAGAVYRELIQNSNDAEASTAEIRFTTSDTANSQLVTQVVYRNDGHPFRPEDWQRLRKIAEGNPDVSKIGAFGVGAYTMFSMCDEPLVISGREALAFAWKGDALWTKTGPSPHTPDQWTSFVLPSRDPYPVPNLVEFGQFLCTSLTFTQCLHTITVFVDEKERLSISKRQLQPPAIVTPPRASSWWSNDGAVTHSPKGIFSLDRTDGSITETVIGMTATLDGETSSITARYVSAVANVRVPRDMAKNMYRVTKKNPPSEVTIQIFIDAAAKQVKRRRSAANAITDTFSPRVGNGSVFIGFKTSQTTGLAAHLAAPLVPTVEREAIDFQDPHLNVFNSEMLSIAGILMRLTLEHSMSLIGKRWEETKEERMALEKELENASNPTNASMTGNSREGSHDLGRKADPQNPKSRSTLFGFASFMSNGVRKIADVISSVDFRGNDDDNLLNPKDARPLSKEEEDAIMLMCSFCPQHSTPDSRVGSLIAKGFGNCMPNASPPVMTSSGVVRSSESRLPFHGIERFVTEGVVRRIVQQNADKYVRHVAVCDFLNLCDLEQALQKRPLSEEELITFLKWWTKFCRVEPISTTRGPKIKNDISFVRKDFKKDNGEDQDSIASLGTFQYYRDEKMFSSELPMPASVLPHYVQDKVSQRVLADKSLSSWFIPLPFHVWASFIPSHSSLTDGRHADSEVRLLVLSALSREHSSRSGQSRIVFERKLQESLSNIRCIPYHSYIPETLATDFPRELYLPSAEIAIFEGLGSFKKVSSAVQKAAISDEFLIALGVRKAISIDFLFTQLDNLKWSGDPKPLITYLCNATLTTQDLDKLKSTKYLPAHGDRSTAYAPSELHLPNPQLVLFPFVKTLHWPSMDELTERSQEGSFLIRLGCRVDPDLRTVLNYLAHETIDDATRLKMLSFLSERLRPLGSYEHEYSTSSSKGLSAFFLMKFLPAVRKDPLTIENPRKLLEAPLRCYTDSEVLCMGFPVLDPLLLKKEGRAVGERFLCDPRPPPDRLVHQLLNITSFAKSKLVTRTGESEEFSNIILASFSNIFDYLSGRIKEFDEGLKQRLREAPFIPCRQDGKLGFFRPTEIYFKNANSDTAELTSTLFCVTDFDPFLAAVGVQLEPSLKDIFRIVISSPSLVLDKVGGEAKYRALLRRIAANPPYSKVTTEMRNAPFLLAYRLEEGSSSQSTSDNESNSEVRKFVFARAREISIVDNSFFARTFNVLTAPPESDLESFYISMGAEYLSKRVKQSFQYDGPLQKNTRLTTDFMTRIQQRKPLLVSPNVTSRTLKSNAAALLEENNLHVYEVTRVKASYTFEKQTRTRDITCYASQSGNRKSSLYISQNFDWFDVGEAIGKLILQKCHLEDSFFIESLLAAPLPQLRARGFPVDRILKKVEPAKVKPAKGEPGIQPVDHPNVSSESKSVAGPSGGTEDEGYMKILTQMFPECDQKHIQSLLGTSPTLETLRQVADTLADGNYPKQDQTEKTRNSRKRKDTSFHQSGPSNPLSRALRGVRNTAIAGSHMFPSAGKMIRLDESSMSNEPVSRSQDTVGQRRMEKLLQDSVKSSRKVPSAGVSSQETVVTSIPEDLQRTGENCEVISGKSLKPCTGRHGTGKTRNGIRLFSSQLDNSSEQYLNSNLDIAEAFSGVLQTLCEVYSLRLHSIAIFHAASGNTVAFNSGGALYFNLRYFASLHWKDKLDARCYSYWFTVVAHELAHNFATPHNKTHGYFTESYVTLFLPKLLEVLR